MGRKKHKKARGVSRSHRLGGGHVNQRASRGPRKPRDARGEAVRKHKAEFREVGW